jgi:glycosyltransferase involved in cell wall biosynthesis
MGTVLSLFGINPKKMGSQEAYARELSLQLARHGWRSVLCFEAFPPEPVARQLAAPNVSIEVLESPERVRRRALTDFVAILRRHRPEIVHLHYVGFLSPYPALARLCSAKQVYFTDHTSRPAGYAPGRAPLWKRVATRVINRPLTGVICVSAYGHRCMTTLGVLPAARFHVIHNGVDTSRGTQAPTAALDFRRKFDIPERRAVVTQVSWIIPEKGIGDLLAAAPLVLETNPDVQFVVVGEGASRDEYIRLAAQMGIQDNFTWTGLVQDPLADGVYAAADVICQVSRWEEVFGLTIAEAMACGRPIVATRVGGIPELVQDGQTGFLVPSGDPEQIADRILALLDDADLRNRLGEAGRSVATARFDLKQNVSQLLKLYGLG